MIFMKTGSGVQRFIGVNTYADTETRRQQCDFICICLKGKKGEAIYVTGREDP
jgi:hypothetical protein